MIVPEQPALHAQPVGIEVPAEFVGHATAEQNTQSYHGHRKITICPHKGRCENEGSDSIESGYIEFSQHNNFGGYRYTGHNRIKQIVLQ